MKAIGEDCFVKFKRHASNPIRWLGIRKGRNEWQDIMSNIIEMIKEDALVDRKETAYRDDYSVTVVTKKKPKSDTDQKQDKTTQHKKQKTTTPQPN